MPLPSGLDYKIKMKQFTLEILCQIIGIGSASGILLKDQKLFLISDNASYLYEYRFDSKTLHKNRFFENEIAENIPKIQKPDLEAIAHFGDEFFIVGSGSTENRNKMFRYNATTKDVKEVDLTNLYLSMQSFGKIKSEDFNIEGLAYTGEKWFFMQRGNNGTGKNGLFTVTSNDLENEFSILYNSYKLPKIKGVQATFTDAVLVDGALYFLATAEDTTSAYDDGQILGSFVGAIDLKTMKIVFSKKISSNHKFEGLTLSKNNGDDLEFLLCEDNDTEKLESTVYKLALQK